MEDKKFIESLNEKNYIFRIGEVSKMTEVSPRQLRYWEQKGYIYSVRSEKMATRVFDHKNFVMVKLIKFYLDQDYSLTVSISKARKRMAEVSLTHDMVIAMHHGFVEKDGKTLMDMGYFDDKKQKRLYGYLNDDGHVSYLVE